MIVLSISACNNDGNRWINQILASRKEAAIRAGIRHRGAFRLRATQSGIAMKSEAPETAVER